MRIGASGISHGDALAGGHVTPSPTIPYQLYILINVLTIIENLNTCITECLNIDMCYY